MGQGVQVYVGRLGLALCLAAGLSVQLITFTFTPILHVSCGTRGTGVCRKTGISAVFSCWHVCTISSYRTRADAAAIIVQLTVITWNESVLFLTLFVLMDYPLHTVKIRMELSILYFKVKISIKSWIYFCPWRMICILAIFADPDEMTPYYLGLYC